MREISLTEVIRKVNGVRYLNLLLLAVAVLMLVLLAREFTAQERALSIPDGGGMAELGARGKAGKGGFSRYSVIGSSGILGASTALSLLHSAPMARQGPGLARPATGNSQVTLLGTVTGEAGKGFAVFKEKGTGKEEVVRSGESVFSLGRLVSVSRYSAVVQSGGRRLTFSMDLNDKGRLMSGPPSPRVHGDLFPSGGLNPFRSRPASHLAKSKGHGKWLVDKRALESALADSNKVMGDARFYPYREGGVVKGFLISQVRPSGVFYGMGIRNGDIILRVNNYAIDAPEKAMSLMKGLKGETDVKVDILRRGKAQTFKYEIR